MPKPKYEIWCRDATGEKLSPWDSTWDTYELAKHEISRRDAPPGAEYFIKKVTPGKPDPFGLKRHGGLKLGGKNFF